MRTSISSLWKLYKSGGDLLIFIALSLATAFFIGQERVISRWEPAYWLLIVPALVMPLLRCRETVNELVFGRAFPLTVFALTSTLWLCIRRDFGAIPPIVLIVWVAGWATRKEARIHRNALYVVTLAFFVTGTVHFLSGQNYEDVPWLLEKAPEPMAATEAPSAPLAAPEQERVDLNINAWGILPGQTAPAFQPWRISVTPNIATSGIFSMLVLLVALGRPRFRPLYMSTVALSAYFAILSFVRAVFVSLALFSATIVALKLLKGMPKARTIAALAMVIGVVLIVAASPFILFYLQDVGPVSRMFLRGETGLSIADIYRQTYRPWLWSEHLKLFWQSSYLLGQGSELAASATKTILNAGHERSDSVSFLTRLLATYGIPALGLFYYLCERAYHHAKTNDAWAIAMLSVIVWLMMSWGSIFHPTNAFFVLCFAIVAKGSDAISDRVQLSSEETALASNDDDTLVFNPTPQH